MMKSNKKTKLSPSAEEKKHLKQLEKELKEHDSYTESIEDDPWQERRDSIIDTMRCLRERMTKTFTETPDQLRSVVEAYRLLLIELKSMEGKYE